MARSAYTSRRSLGMLGSASSLTKACEEHKPLTVSTQNHQVFFGMHSLVIIATWLFWREQGDKLNMNLGYTQSCMHLAQWDRDATQQKVRHHVRLEVYACTPATGQSPAAAACAGSCMSRSTNVAD
jgi:hypothetical protein